jgi:hypothetical protein
VNPGRFGRKCRRPPFQLHFPAKLAVLAVVGILMSSCGGPRPEPSPTTPPSTTTPGAYPWHTGIVATTFWVGEIFDPKAEDGSQVMSTYDSQWMESYGGCDGVVKNGCETEPRTSSNDYFPSSMTPLENPFYLDLPYDDINNAAAFAERATVIPWAGEPVFAGHASNRSVSYMKNRWVRLRMGDKECYGQIEDAGPGQYQDKAYVFGTDDARPKNKEFNGAGMDVSPALNGCLGFSDLDGQDDKVDWQFVERKDVPAGPWLKVETQSQVQ